jgi:HD superfamily phosphodiesterase
MVTKQHDSAIKTFAKSYYQKLDQTHGLEHFDRTLHIAKYLTQAEGANWTIVRYGAMLHQIHNSKIVRIFLTKIGCDNEFIEKIVHCIGCISPKHIKEAKTIEAKVVYDADKLQVIGPFGVIREMAYRKSLGESFREAYTHTRRIEEKLFNTLQTRTAKKLAKNPHQLLNEFWKYFEQFD